MLAGDKPVLVHNCDLNTDGYLYRGLAKGHTGYDAAAQGRAVPNGGNSSIIDHVGGNQTDTNFTSWSDALEVAVDHSQRLNGEWIGKGVIMRIRTAGIDPRVGPSRNIQIHDSQWDRGFFEDEHLLVGEIHASEISFDFGETWASVAGR
ncbi:hypothetical protein ACFXPW_29540 [Streptomyces goshikiensis]|uniref:hypothetical protein n=1 Tax=Streptomyces goshikiensis TaxID=1942 RepID=UPI0036B2BB71